MPTADHAQLQDDESQSPYAVREPGEIAFVLRGLQEARALIDARLVPGGHGCPTALLAVHDDGSLVLDGNRDEALNQRMAAASRLVCSTQLDLVPIRFRLPTPVRIVHEGYVAFAAPWPQTLLRLQRRETYRLECSAGAPATLHVGDAARAPDPDGPGVRVLDVSGGGVALAIPDGAHARFQPQAPASPCLLRLGDAPPLPVTIEVAYAARHDLRGAAGWRVCCRFVDLPAAAEQQVMQFIFQAERKRNARQRRGG
jgi:flagellar brake protein